MGLDTHDYGILTEPMQANMVFTVERIYIPAGFGIRLEDDWIQESGEPFNLMRIPIEADEIESLMN
jgi:Xaa-Pro aminopeptidase